MTAELRWRAFRRAWRAWAWWERLSLRLHPITPIREHALLAYRARGDALELHLDARELNRRRQQPGYSTFGSVHEMRAELAVLADRIRKGELRGVSLLKGTSLMGEAGGVLGFEVRPLPHTLGVALQQYFMVGIDAVYHPLGLRRRATRRWPVETTMTVEELLRRYPEKSDSSSAAR